MNSRNTRLSFMSALLLLLALLVMPATAHNNDASVVTGSDDESIVDVSLNVDELDALSKKEWKALRKQQMEALHSADDQLWPVALANITYLARFHSDEVNFKCAMPWLVDTFAYAPRQQDRMAALAAIHAIGDDQTMAYLAEYIKDERNPQIKRVAIAALVDHYDLDWRKGTVTVEPPVPAL
ncbi:MAG: hypothetical protein ACOCTG_02005 [Bacteroidota bacterium]